MIQYCQTDVSCFESVNEKRVNITRGGSLYFPGGGSCILIGKSRVGYTKLAF